MGKALSTLIILTGIITNSFTQIVCDGGQVFTISGEDTTIACVVNGEAIIDFDSANVVGTGYAYAVTDTKGFIMAVPISINDFNFAEVDSFENHVYGIAFEGDLTIEPGKHISTATATVCEDISTNVIVVYRMEPPDCQTNVGIEKQNRDEYFSVYPVPANSTIYIKLTDHFYRPSQILLTDIGGRILQNQLSIPGISNYHLSHGKLSPGVYFVTVYTADKVMTRRVVVW